MHLADEEQRRRIIELVKNKTHAECPELQLVDIQEGFRVWVFYWCHAEEVGYPEHLRDIRLSAEEAEYIGLDRSAWRAPPETFQPSLFTQRMASCNHVYWVDEVGIEAAVVEPPPALGLLVEVAVGRNVPCRILPHR